MPEPDFLIKSGDNASSIFATLENSGGTPVDILGASITFKMGPIGGGTLTIAGAATNQQVGAGTVDGSRGDVVYPWAAGNTSTPGLYLAEWEVTYVSGTVQTFPNDGYSLVLITPGL